MQNLVSKLTSILMEPIRLVEDHFHHSQIVRGYPVTRHPFYPKILENAVDWKTYKDCGVPILGLTLAEEDAELVSIQNLNHIRKNILTMMEDDAESQEVMKILKDRFPNNTLAVSMALNNFQLGRSCQEFLPVSEFKIPDGAYFTYQKISERLQVTYYNENGNEFTAGICLYPVSPGTNTLKEDTRVLYDVLDSIEPYPLGDREKQRNYIEEKIYGRRCGLAGRRVIVYCGSQNGMMYHLKFDDNDGNYVNEYCKECTQEAKNYKWEEPKEKSVEVPSVAAASPNDSEVSLATKSSDHNGTSKLKKTEQLTEVHKDLTVQKEIEADTSSKKAEDVKYSKDYQLESDAFPTERLPCDDDINEMKDDTPEIDSEFDAELVN
ncbi:hypothetical protein CRE_14197 [Caenorhabditis remanei]|uniref:Uncharacterized protein n=1 Tax=Caenorhabditis remanei TaxID=31234 RepID=E3N1L6_CAERE|nr:hypothetical protein CRE_14197 [Caenorhabditis remanei]